MYVRRAQDSRHTKGDGMGMPKRWSGGVFFVLIMWLGLFSSPVFAQITDIHTAINKAGLQRMLSQRMAKAYLQIGLGVDVESSIRSLNSAIPVFDRQVIELRNYAPTIDTRETYLQMERHWLLYKEILQGSAPSPENARKVLELSEALLQLAHRGTSQLVTVYGRESGALVGVAGRQRMLSQRMAKHYQAISWGVAPPAVAAELLRDKRSFVIGMKALSGAPATTPAIREALAQALLQWQLFEAALDAKATVDTKTRSDTVAVTSEHLLEAMDSITTLFEKLGV